LAKQVRTGQNALESLKHGLTLRGQTARQEGLRAVHLVQPGPSGLPFDAHLILYATITCDVHVWLTHPLGPIGYTPSGAGQNAYASLNHWTYVKKCYQDGLKELKCASKERSYSGLAAARASHRVQVPGDARGADYDGMAEVWFDDVEALLPTSVGAFGGYAERALPLAHLGILWASGSACRGGP
jgi:hypothetical protein